MATAKTLEQAIEIVSQIVDFGSKESLTKAIANYSCQSSTFGYSSRGLQAILVGVLPISKAEQFGLKYERTGEWHHVGIAPGSTCAGATEEFVTSELHAVLMQYIAMEQAAKQLAAEKEREEYLKKIKDKMNAIAELEKELRAQGYLSKKEIGLDFNKELYTKVQVSENVTLYKRI